MSSVVWQETKGTTTMPQTAWICGALVAAVLPSMAQPAFETASIKVWTPNGGRHGFGGGKRISNDPVMLRFRVASLRELIQFAYGLQQQGDIAGPDLPDNYDIDAKAGAPATPE